MYRSNKLFFSFKSLAVLLIIFSLGACKSTENTSSDEAETDQSEREAKYWERIESSRSSYNEADVNFMNGMIGHHAQALIMSELAPENDASPEIRRLASRIINAQKDEINSMQQWLRDRDEQVPEVHIDGLDLMLHGVDDHHHDGHEDMPGMLSQEQLEELADAEGSEFDRLFLEYMIQHHEGAVVMVDTLFGTDGGAQDEEAFRLASDIQADQITEIERMELMLEDLSESENT